MIETVIILAMSLGVHANGNVLKLEKETAEKIRIHNGIDVTLLKSTVQFEIVQNPKKASVSIIAKGMAAGILGVDHIGED